MFTGIIEETGRVAAFTQGPDSWRLQIAAGLVPSDVRLGDSVAVNGCCLTVTEFDAGHLWFDVLEETRRLTNFAQLAPGALVNLERSLRADTRLGGHFVSGHIDAPGRVEVFEARGKDHYLKVGVPAGFARYLVYKGSVAIDGISLTVAEAAGDSFAVWLIPHTLAVTNLRGKKAGDTLNLEFDLLAKYVEKLNAARPA
ncbi:riboflavin synthase [Opitutus sp. GAS368]|jgi:riboflavin synthase|uniref:riboflavin synthase n=1 Tax=Opitutus sp. GAS368 TaxID=1882749 RepID=UPI00087D2B61|nr:riboflavin synthase [Opitutus sp. GAS368]SDS52709.1 riboflavin synthase alpha chain [Opitutus sp. GAS368]